MVPPTENLSEASIEAILTQLLSTRDLPPLTFYPNAVEYRIENGRLCWRLVELSKVEQGDSSGAKLFAEDQAMRGEQRDDETHLEDR